MKSIKLLFKAFSKYYYCFLMETLTTGNLNGTYVFLAHHPTVQAVVSIVQRKFLKKIL